MDILRCGRFWALFAAVLVFALSAHAQERSPATIVAAAPQQTSGQEKSSRDSNRDAPTPEGLMRRRFPQPIKVADLIGVAVLDWRDSTIGYVSEVARTGDGKIELIVLYSARLGWAAFLPGKRLVAVPIEKVAMLGRYVAALDMPREDFDAAPTWAPSAGTAIPRNDTIHVALTKR